MEYVGSVTGSLPVALAGVRLVSKRARVAAVDCHPERGSHSDSATDGHTDARDTRTLRYADHHPRANNARSNANAAASTRYTPAPRLKGGALLEALTLLIPWTACRMRGRWPCCFE
jgi:hypothetical protein